MKTYKVDFSKGINVVADKRMVPEGYIVLADNIDLRSGSLHPFKFPEPYIGISGGIPAGTTCIWEFKNNWFFSALYRSYSAEYVNSQTRVYFTESSIAPAGTYVSSHAIPQKVVNGIQAQLGTPVPLIAPSVSATTSYTPNSFVATESTTGGYLSTGAYSYRISAIINNQIMPPAGSVLINIPQVAGSNISTGSITLTWHPIQGGPNYTVDGYVIFGRSLGTEQTLFTLGAGATTVTDSGSISSAGAYAVNYQPINPLTYVYTYVRDVGTMPDESGPSPTSNTTNSSFVRIITRNQNTDGFYTNATAYSGFTYSSTELGGIVYGIAYNGVDAVLSVNSLTVNSPWWVNNLKLVFQADPTNTQYAFSIPYALSPVLAAPTLVPSSTGGTIPAGTYTYAICALRGAITSIYGYPTTLPVSTQASPTVSTGALTGSTNSVTLTWVGINGASGYMIIRYNGTTYQVVGIIAGNTTSFADTNSYGTFPTVTGFPSVNNTGITYNAINTALPISWENPSPSNVGNIIVMSEAVPASVLSNIFGTIYEPYVYLAVSPIFGLAPSTATAAPTLGVTAGSGFPAGTYYIMVAALNGATLISQTAYGSITLGSTENITVTFASVSGATSYNIYLYQSSNNYIVYNCGSFTSSPITLTAPGTLIETNPGFSGVDQDVVNITFSPYASINGVVTYYQDQLNLWGYPFINVFTPGQATQFTTVPITIQDVPNNAYYKYWNIYRAGDTGTEFTFVSQQPIGVTQYTDTIGVTGLGESIPTLYSDATTGGTVSFQPPPIDAGSPVLYNGMMFITDGNNVRWSPTGYPDAYPSIYIQSFPFPPQNLLGYGGGVYVFCENGVFRLDGYLPGQISMTQLAADGCIAPYSPRVLGEHIIYLAKRGLMMIRGMEAVPITERFIPYRLMTEPSAFIGGISAQNFWWFTTDHTSSYGALLDIGMNPIPAADGFGIVTAQDKPLTSLIYEARSFVWQNKYYLYFVNAPTSDFQGNPCWCVDLGIMQLAFVLPNYPISTLGFKPTDVHVSSTGECYSLLTVDPTNDPLNQTQFAISEGQFNTSFSPIQTAVGNGVTNKFYYGGGAIYRNDWQGNQLLYSTARTNYLLYSQAQNNADWTLTGATLTSGITDPAGGTNAFTLTATSSNGSIYQNPTVPGVGTYTDSMWVRRRTGTGNVTMTLPNSGAYGFTPTSAWQQFSDDQTIFTGTHFAIGIVLATNGDAVDIAFGQVEPGQVATSYIPTTNAAASITDYSISGGFATFSQTPLSGAILTGVYAQAQMLYRFNPTIGQNVPMRWRTSEMVAGAPQTRKRWREVRLNGSGTHQLRVFIDGALLTMANGSTVTTLTLSESPIHPSRIMLPVGSWGYSCSVEGCGDGTVRLIELGFDPMAGEDQKGDEKE